MAEPLRARLLGVSDLSSQGTDATTTKKYCTITLVAFSLAALLVVVLWNPDNNNAAWPLQSLASGKPEENVPASSIWFQAHSVNDLRQWKSLYLKGARSFKIDPHYIRGDGTRRNRSKLLFTHNYPIYNLPYDDFDGLYKELDRSGGIGSVLRDGKEKIRIQLCFKSAPVISCNGLNRTSEQRNWLTIIDNFYDKVESNPYIQEHVEFLLDGGGKPSGCLQTKWRKWKSVWIANDPMSPSSALKDGGVSAKADNSRFVILNNPAGLTSWQNFASMGFGRFASLPYPLQIWEPDDQNVIHKHAEVYRRSAPNHAPGLHFVSNSDPAMIALHSQSRNTFNGPVLIDASIKCPIGVYATNVFILAVYSTTSGVRVSLFYKQFGMQVIHQLTDMSLDRKWTRFSPSERDHHATLSDEQGVFSHVRIRVLDGQFNYVHHELKAPMPMGHGFERTATCLLIREFTNGVVSKSNEFIAIWTTSSPSSSRSTPDDPFCSLVAIRFSVNKDETTVKETVCINWSPKISPTDADITRLSSGSFGIVFSDQGKNVYSALWVLGKNQGRTTEPRIITVGVAPRFSAAGNTVALVLGDSFCSNNLDYNRRAGPQLLCDIPPVSSRGVATYTIGSINHWLEFFRTPSKRILSACDTELLHGAFDIGKCPQVALLMTNTFTGEGEFAEIHRSVDDLKLLERSCATAKWEKSLVLNRFKFFVENQKLLRWKTTTRILQR